MPKSTGKTDEMHKPPARSLLKRIDIGLTTGIFAVVVSLLAVAVAYNQTKLAEKTAKASVLPVLRVEMFYERSAPPLRFETLIHNEGVGIARIETARFLDSENGLEINFVELGEFVANPPLLARAKRIKDYSTGFLPAGETKQSILMTWEDDSNNADQLLNYLGNGGDQLTIKLDVVLCYCSVFDDCWTTSRHSKTAPKPVENCQNDGVFHDSMNPSRDS